MMRKPIWILAAVFAATPLFAQDDAPATPFAGGGGGAQVFTRVDAANPMEQVKAFLAKANITLNADQEKTLRPSVEAAIKQLQDISERFAAERGARGGGERRGRGDGGGRGDFGGRGRGPRKNHDGQSRKAAHPRPAQGSSGFPYKTPVSCGLK